MPRRKIYNSEANTQVTNSQEPNLQVSQVNPATEQNWNYEEKVAEIEEIISRIEAGDLDLVDVFEQFSTAMNYLQQCESFLQHHQQQIDLLVETLNPES